MKVAALTDKGRKRQLNQDVFFETRDPIGTLPNLFFVCDGMGGEKAGGHAASEAKKIVLNYVNKNTEQKSFGSIMTKALSLANLSLYNQQLTNSDFSGLGTTFVGGVIDNEQLIVANVGDSRCYHIRNMALPITKDHSLVEELIAKGAIKRGSKAYFEKRHIITRALGAENTVKVDFWDCDIMLGDYILFCSDGLSTMLDDVKIFDIVTANKSIEEKVKDLITEANNNGGRDNITVILIEIDSLERRDK